MSMSEEGEYLASVDNEQIHGYGEFGAFLAPYTAAEEASVSVESIHPRWLITPRCAADFSYSDSKLTSCRDSDYEEWLENYYVELYKECTTKNYSDKEVDTSDLKVEESVKPFTSLFQPLKKNIWSESTKYWGPKEIRRHWPVRQKTNDYLLFPSIHPMLDLRSRYGRYHSQLNSAAAVPENHHKVAVCRSFKKALINLGITEPQLMKFMNCDNFCNLKWFDFLTKNTITRLFCKFLRTQFRMEKVYLENANLERMEGIILLCAISRNGGDAVKELHMWKMFGYGQSPVLMNELSSKGTIIKQNPTWAYFTKVHYLQILNNFSALTHLSVNYAYLANRCGDALLCLKCIRNGCLKELRILCLKDERPCLTNPGYGVGGWTITDGVWRRAAEWCPHMRVKFVFLDMPQYDNIIVFLSKSIPMSYVFISSGKDFTFENPWDIDSTLLELRNWYASTLETLCLHLWHHRDLLDIVIKNKILDEFPHLINFEYIGVLQDVETLEAFCCQLSKGMYKLKTLQFWVEERYTNRKKVQVTRKRVSEIREKYRRRFQVIDLDADIRTYAL